MSSYSPILPTQSEWWLADVEYVSVQQSEQVSNSSECSFAPDSQQLSITTMSSYSASESILCKEGMPHRDTLPLAALQSPSKVQTQEHTHHDQQWVSRQLKVWWSRLKITKCHISRSKVLQILQMSLCTQRISTWWTQTVLNTLWYYWDNQGAFQMAERCSQTVHTL